MRALLPYMARSISPGDMRAGCTEPAYMPKSPNSVDEHLDVADVDGNHLVEGVALRRCVDDVDHLVDLSPHPIDVLTGSLDLDGRIRIRFTLPVAGPVKMPILSVAQHEGREDRAPRGVLSGGYLFDPGPHPSPRF